ncbi:O-antigen ligase family protein [Flavobacterium zepuense]|uniref:O-antigen ligase family protein n=1 Tax=Flavobacterium zepuense TaxID=2593302 RepID=A0A552UVB6_9FLAO|nr:O-antigen ligase family protein [Flavobacterium zepuense]TRW22149.1 O-antigen ligase family protein [Flavobacterium zepuense]
MIIRPEKIYQPLFIMLVLLQLYFPSFKANVFLQLITLAFCALIGNVSFSKKFLWHILPLVLLLAVGFISTVVFKYKMYDILKDVFHFIKPLTGLFLGYILFKRIGNFHLFIKSIVIAAMISVAIHAFILIFMVKSWSNIESIREFTKDNFLDLFALILLIFYRKFERKPLFSKAYTVLFIALLFASCVLYFSRTMIIVAGILVVSMYGLTRITALTLRIAGAFTVLLIMLYAFLDNANIQRGKPGLEGFLYKLKMAPEEIFAGQVDRENLAALWDHWRGYEAARALALMKQQPSSFIIGTGHGSLINLKFYAPLTGEPKGVRYISELHNGYMYVFYKTGIIGILLYLFLLARWYGYIYKPNNLKTIMVSAIGLIYLISTLTISGVYNGRDIIIFILGGALYFAQAKRPHLQ